MIPFYRQQTDWTCGAAAVRMVFASLGIKKSESELASLLKTTRTKSGTLHKNIVALVEEYKLNYVVGRNATIGDLKRFLNSDYRLIVGYWLSSEKCGHYAVVKQIKGNKIYLLDPLFGPKKACSLAVFKHLWKDGEGEKCWFIGLKK